MTTREMTTLEELAKAEQWRPLMLSQCPLSSAASRSPERTDQIHDYLRVWSSLRYASVKDATYCATYAWDVTRAMGAEIPHWIDEDSLVTAAMGKGKEIDANFWAKRWLPEVGQRFGWVEIQRRDAQPNADLGHPVIAIWENKTTHPCTKCSGTGSDPASFDKCDRCQGLGFTVGHGHVAPLVPSHGEEGLFIAQAGTHNFRRGQIDRGFGPDKLHEVKFYAHD